MLCLLCLERRLGRSLRLQDFKLPVHQQVAQFLAQRPMPGNVIAPTETDEALMPLATEKPRKVARIIGRTMTSSPARAPGLPDYFYLERVRLLKEDGKLNLVGDTDDLVEAEVCLP